MQNQLKFRFTLRCNINIRNYTHITIKGHKSGTIAHWRSCQLGAGERWAGRLAGTGCDHTKIGKSRSGPSATRGAPGSLPGAHSRGGRVSLEGLAEMRRRDCSPTATGAGRARRELRDDAASISTHRRSRAPSTTGAQRRTTTRRGKLVCARVNQSVSQSGETE